MTITNVGQVLVTITLQDGTDLTINPSQQVTVDDITGTYLMEYHAYDENGNQVLFS